jgi:cytochrome c-type biogenesis protein CcmE
LSINTYNFAAKSKLLMTLNQRQRIWKLSLGLIGAGSLLTFLLVSLNQQILFFVTPTQLHQHPVDIKPVRLGGLVKIGSIRKLEDTLSVSFIVTDQHADQEVYYRGILPDLFREGQGVVVEGKRDDRGTFIATHVLAKHDENYIPREVYQKLRQSTP